MYVVITENDESKWEDQTGVAYHFPQRYLSILKPGTSIVYYKGKLKNKSFTPNRLSEEPHYFGIGKIGQIYRDRHSTKGDSFAVIEDYKPFVIPVLIRHQGNYIEHIPANRESNYWRDGARQIDQNMYEKILLLAGNIPGDEETSVEQDNVHISDVDNSDHLLESFVEGDKTKKYVTKYERDPRLRKLAVLIHGTDCKGCGFNFESVYGVRGKGFIHVHHLKPISEYDGARKVNPESDLTVLCPNCHCMIHRYKVSTLSLDELKTLISRSGV